MLVEAHRALGSTLFYAGSGSLAARPHFDAGDRTAMTPQQHRASAFLYGTMLASLCLMPMTARTLWLLGYPDQALRTERTKR